MARYRSLVVQRRVRRRDTGKRRNVASAPPFSERSLEPKAIGCWTIVVGPARMGAGIHQASVTRHNEWQLMEAERVRVQLDRILASATFAEAERGRKFLCFVVELALAGRVVEIKESVVAVEVLGRAASFDPRSDPIVRVEAGRLRSRLAAYYQSEGCSDAVVIDLPKGGYVHQFQER